MPSWGLASTLLSFCRCVMVLVPQASSPPLMAAWLHAVLLKIFLYSGNAFLLFLYVLQSLSSSAKPNWWPISVKAQVGIVLAQQNAVFGTAGKHAVGLFGAFGNQIVYQHAYVGFGSGSG
jgi:hypothetical protein